MFSRGFREDCGNFEDWEKPTEEKKAPPTDTPTLTPIPLDKECYYLTLPDRDLSEEVIERFRRQWKAMTQNSEVKPMLVIMPSEFHLHEMTVSDFRKTVEGMQELLSQREKETGYYDKVSPTELIKHGLSEVYLNEKEL